jgi:cyclopropane-fatty-acyl-phospholipid synthase
LRTWEWYLAYCEGGYAERYLGLAQLVFVRPGSEHRVDSSALAPVAVDPYQG